MILALKPLGPVATDYALKTPTATSYVYAPAPLSDPRQPQVCIMYNHSNKSFTHGCDEKWHLIHFIVTLQKKPMKGKKINNQNPQLIAKIVRVTTVSCNRIQRFSGEWTRCGFGWSPIAPGPTHFLQEVFWECWTKSVTCPHPQPLPPSPPPTKAPQPSVAATPRHSS